MHQTSDNLCEREKLGRYMTGEAIDTPSASGDGETRSSALKPLVRKSGEGRLARIEPATRDAHQLVYKSPFVRNFLRGDYNFCAAKIPLARDGKIKAIDNKFLEIENWFTSANRWLSGKPQRPFELESDSADVQVTHPLVGRLIRVLMQYDSIFGCTIFALMANSITADDRRNTLETIENKIKALKSLCIPEPTRFDADGNLQPGQQSDQV